MLKELRADPQVSEGTYQYVPEKHKQKAPPEKTEKIRRGRELSKLLANLPKRG